MEYGEKGNEIYLKIVTAVGLKASIMKRAKRFTMKIVKVK